MAVRSLLLPPSRDICLLLFLVIYLFILQSRHHLSSLPRDHHIFSSFPLYSHRDFISVFNFYFRNCFIPLITRLNHCLFYYYSCRLHDNVRVPGMWTCFCPPTCSVKFIRASLRRSVKFKSVLFPTIVVFIRQADAKLEFVLLYALNANAVPLFVFVQQADVKRLVERSKF